MEEDSHESKFKKALESLSRVHFTANRSSPLSVSPASDRPLERNLSFSPVKYARNSYNETSPSPSRLALPSSHSPSPISSARKSGCRPWDSEDFFERLSSFKPSTWFAKPEIISPISCARRGWVNVNFDMIGCDICGVKLSFSYLPTWPRQQIEKVSREFSDKLDIGHKSTCPWRGNVCPESAIHVPPQSKELMILNFNERVKRLLTLPFMPYISTDALNEMLSLNDSAVRRLLSVPFTGSNAVIRIPGGKSKAYLQALLLISLCGWAPKTPLYPNDPNDSSSAHDSVIHSSSYNPPLHDIKSSILNCHACKASVGLWNFKQLSPDASYSPYFSPDPSMSSHETGNDDDDDSHKADLVLSNHNYYLDTDPQKSPSFGKPVDKPIQLIVKESTEELQKQKTFETAMEIVPLDKSILPSDFVRPKEVVQEKPELDAVSKDRKSAESSFDQKSKTKPIEPTSTTSSLPVIRMNLTIAGGPAPHQIQKNQDSSQPKFGALFGLPVFGGLNIPLRKETFSQSTALSQTEHEIRKKEPVEADEEEGSKLSLKRKKAMEERDLDDSVEGVMVEIEGDEAEEVQMKDTKTGEFTEMEGKTGMELNSFDIDQKGNKKKKVERFDFSFPSQKESTFSVPNPNPKPSVKIAISSNVDAGVGTSQIKSNKIFDTDHSPVNEIVSYRLPPSTAAKGKTMVQSEERTGEKDIRGKEGQGRKSKEKRMESEKGKEKLDEQVQLPGEGEGGGEREMFGEEEGEVEGERKKNQMVTSSMYGEYTDHSDDEDNSTDSVDNLPVYASENHSQIRNYGGTIENGGESFMGERNPNEETASHGREFIHSLSVNESMVREQRNATGEEETGLSKVELTDEEQREGEGEVGGQEGEGEAEVDLRGGHASDSEGRGRTDNAIISMGTEAEAESEMGGNQEVGTEAQEGYVDNVPSNLVRSADLVAPSYSFIHRAGEDKNFEFSSDTINSDGMKKRRRLERFNSFPTPAESFNFFHDEPNGREYTYSVSKDHGEGGLRGMEEGEEEEGERAEESRRENRASEMEYSESSEGEGTKDTTRGLLLGEPGLVFEHPTKKGKGKENREKKGKEKVSEEKDAMDRKRKNDVKKTKLVQNETDSQIKRMKLLVKEEDATNIAVSYEFLLDDAPNAFHPLLHHRYFCPWIKSDMFGSASSTLALWLASLQAIDEKSEPEEDRL